MTAAALAYGRGGAGGYAAIVASSGGATVVVAAASGYFIRVIACALMANGVSTVKFTDGTTDCTGNFPLAANTGFVLNENLSGWFETTHQNAALSISLGSAVGVGGCLAYLLVPA